MDDDANGPDDRAAPAAGDTVTGGEAADETTGDPDEPAGPPAVPAARRSWFDRPLFWLGLVGIGVVLAVALSFAVERTDLSGSVGDVGHFCQQLRNVQQVTSIASVGTSPADLARTQNLVRQLAALEAVAPDPVHDDVTTVRQSAETLLAGVRSYQSGDTAGRSAALASMAQAASAGQDALGRMSEYAQEACGIDLQAHDTTPTTTP